jgi:ABC-type transport system involved in multi-copper enzyme maturation permease subunit
VSPLLEIRLLAIREVRRTIRSPKGIAVGIITLLGAIVASLVSVVLEANDRAHASAESTQAYVDLKEGAVAQATGDPSLAHYIAHIPTSLLIFLQITIWLSPLLVALLGFDGISGELQHRAIRFWTVRTRRSSFFVGKLLGLWALVGIIIFVINGLAGGVALARGYVGVGDLASWGIRFWLVALVIAGAWAAIATVISACFRSPILALLTTFAIFFVLWTAGVGGIVARVRNPAEVGLASHVWYQYFYPNAYDSLLLSPEPARALGGLAVLLAFMVAMSTAGSFVLQRRDL